MQKVKGVCTECGGDGKREPLGQYEVPGVCTHCNGSRREPQYRETMLDLILRGEYPMRGVSE